MQESPLSVYSEIGRLSKVLLHRPGDEVENLTPGMMERLLFDDIPYLKIARQEHDAFVELLRGRGTEVVYVEDLVADVLMQEDRRRSFLKDFLHEAEVLPESVSPLTEYFTALPVPEMISKLIAGLRSEERPEIKGERDHFLIDPIPNFYFSRDPFAVIGQGVSIHRMATATRRRETLFADYIFRYHPLYRSVPRYYERTHDASLEGGDILILSSKVIAVGISQRSERKAVEKLCRNLLTSGESFERVLALKIPEKRAFMHLDTVFTMVDYDKFTIHPGVEDPMVIYEMTMEEGRLVIREEEAPLADLLKKHLELDDVHLIRCGGKHGIDAEREQWNDGSNTLAIAPGEVVVYERNHVTNRYMEEMGVKLYYMPSSELSRGRGGPRCMSMPLVREKIQGGK